MIAIILFILFVCLALLFFASIINTRKEEPDVWYLQRAYDNAFWLKNELETEKPELYKKASKHINAILDSLVEVSKIMEEYNQNNS